jgi:demethylmenaquinone methyltransferase / 2-methoxy-6-polyprenyl-1,4-benzoquinol methylase
MQHDKVTPYQDQASKNQQVAKMFDAISGRYDFLNSLLSAGIHKGWRKKCVKLLEPKQPKRILDVATGTGDFAIACATLKPESITGIDISEGMMKVGREKLIQLKLDQLIQLETGNAEALHFPENSFDAIVVGFGVRNFQNLELGLSNLYRVLKPGGTLAGAGVLLSYQFFCKNLLQFLFLLHHTTYWQNFFQRPQGLFLPNRKRKSLPTQSGFCGCACETEVQKCRIYKPEFWEWRRYIGGRSRG